MPETRENKYTKAKLPELEKKSKLLNEIADGRARAMLEMALRYLQEQIESISWPYLPTKQEVESIEEWCKIVEDRIRDYKEKIPEQVRQAVKHYLAEVRKKYPIVNDILRH